MKEIGGLLLLLSTQVISAVFTVIREPRMATFPDEFPETIPCFPFSDYELTRSTYWYFFFEHIIVIMFAAYILWNSSKFFTALKIFLIIQVVDLMDYMLFYGEIWFYADTFPVSWNVMKVVIFLLAMANEALQLAERKLQNE